MTTPRTDNPFTIVFGVVLTIILNWCHIFAQPHYNSLFGLLPFVSYAPFFAVLARKGPLRIVNMYLFSLATLTMIGVLTSLRFHISVFYGLCGGVLNGVLFPTILAAIWMAFPGLFERSVGAILALTCLEFGIARLFGTAVTLPIALYRFPFVLQPISIFGTQAMETLLFASNWMIGLVISGSGKQKVNAVISWFLVIGIWLIICAQISWSLSSAQGTTVRVSTISPGYRFQGALDDLVNMTKTTAEKGAEYIVWPEVYVKSPIAGESCESYVNREIVPKLYPGIKSNVVVGCEEELTDSTCATGNIAVTIGTNGTILGTYGKQHPVTMIGEHSCYRNGYRKYDSSSNVGFSTLICYDADFEDSSAIVSDMGAALILTPSEDWSAARTHFAASVFRAIENRVAIAKSDWGWDSAIISPTGEIVKMFNSKKIHRQILTADVTVYPQFQGGWNRIRHSLFPLVCLSTLGFLVFVSVRRIRRSQSVESIEARLLI
jgi:apolipoprotein N-acyltransferase